jgi:hypothetical protein
MNEQLEGSTPSITQFDPTLIPFQIRVIKDVRRNLDHSKVNQLLFSGSVGSSKSLLLAHLLVTHCMLFKRARALMGRQTLPDLKDTLIQKVIEHIGDDLREGKDYDYNKSSHKFTFSNGSELISRSWHDKDFKKFRSLELSAAGIEEASENDEAYKGFYFELLQRIGRLSHVPEKWIALATNPDAPSHWLYKHFIAEKKPNRHVYYSKTADNPFLPASYIENLKENLDPKQALRMLEGQWVEIDEEVIYYNYKSSRNFIDKTYETNPNYPIDISHDFNIGEGKPMSAVASQYIEGKFHFYRTFIIDGARTGDIMDEMASTELFELPNRFRVFGDSSGKSRDTRSIKSDYDIIKEFLSNYKRKDGSNLQFETLVPLANPPIRERHNLVNAQCQNALKEIKLFVYKDAAPLDEGLRLTKLKKGGNYIEDDSFRFQHVTTAVGYMIHYQLKKWREPPKSYRR